MVDFATIIGVLAGVEVVVIGGLAAQAHGSRAQNAEATSWVAGISRGRPGPLRMEAMRGLGGLALTLAIAIGPAACKRTPTTATPAPAAVPAPIPPPPAVGQAPGEVGPLGSDCYDTSHAKACPPDPSDPSGKKLPAYGGRCQFPVCRPCGSETAPSFRDEHGAPSAGYCICVPTSDSSGRGTLTCYSPGAWKSRGN